MKTLSLNSHSQKETMQIGVQLARHLKKGDIVCLMGELGSGKTTLVKGVAQGLKIKKNAVHSPTFVLLNVYEGQKSLYHFDLYRIDELTEIANIGFDEFLYGDGISVIEWAERLGALTPKEYIKIELLHKGEEDRLIKISTRGERYAQWGKQFQERVPSLR